MRNKYEIQIWVDHACIETKVFTNKAKAKKWVKESGYDLASDYGQCFILPVVNGQPLEISDIYNFLNGKEAK